MDDSSDESSIEDVLLALLEKLHQTNSDKVERLLAGFLLYNKPDFRATNKAGLTCLHLAATSASVTSLKLLLKKGADPNAASAEKAVEPPLHAAARAGRDKNVDLLLEWGADIHMTHVVGRTALHAATVNNQFSTIKVLLINNANVDQQDDRGMTALCLAAAETRASMPRKSMYSTAAMETLIKGGADLDIPDCDGWTALHHGSMSKAAIATSFVSTLICHGADVNIKAIKGGWTALHNASECSHAETVKGLLQAGANINEKSADGSTALHLASLSASGSSRVRVLIDHGADVSVKDEDGCTALHNASECSGAETVEHLLQAGADIEERNEEGSTALHLASLSDSGSSRVRVLIDYGANFSVKDQNGRTALHNAVESGSDTTLNFLLGSGASVDEKDHQGLTALHLACMSLSSITKVYILIRQGASVNIKDEGGQTALHYATGAGNELAICSLLDYGADGAVKGDFRGKSAHLKAKNMLTEPFGHCGQAEKSQERKWLHEAVVTGNMEEVERCLEAEEFDVNTPDYHGQTLLHIAIHTRAVPMIVLLVEKGADTEALNHEGKTPFDIAFEHKATSVMMAMVAVSL